tara:strand:- start:639 stop:947 length:309 start_codon:yes stop_codon:yes gene_type:complete
MKYLRTILLATVLLFSANALLAQTKYEYATVTYSPSYKVMVICINGSSFEKISVSKGDTQHILDTTPALKQIAKMNKDGWELFNTSTTGSVLSFVFVLRKER